MASKSYDAAQLEMGQRFVLGEVAVVPVERVADAEYVQLRVGNRVLIGCSELRDDSGVASVY